MLLKIINKVFSSFKNAKISKKLTIIYAIMFSLVLIILNAATLYGVKFYLYGEANKQLDDVQTIMINKLEVENNQIDIKDNNIFYDIPSKESISIIMTGEDGRIINSLKSFNYNVSDIHKSWKKEAGKGKRIEDKKGHLMYKNVKIESVKYGNLYIQIVKDLYREYDFLKILFAVMALTDFIGIIAAIVLGYIVSKKMLKPIAYITKTAENISINNLKERIDIKGPEDELKRLANTFNNMIDRLQKSFDRQVQFVSDASHELRTPIAVIQGYANLLDRWGKDDREALEKSIYAIKLEAANMGELVEKLLFLARGDSGAQLIEKKEFCINELIDEVVNETRIVNENYTITSKKNDDAKILADYKMIKQMIRIFIDNSIKFTPYCGEIDISLENVEDRYVKITVSDTGIGIPKDEIEKIFNRFYIVDKSRSKEKGGTGLGLSIAKWIVDVHGGKINVESEEGKGTKVIVSLNLK